MPATATSPRRRAPWCSLDTWRRPSLARWSLMWGLAGAIFGCSAVPDIIGEGRSAYALGLLKSISKGLPLPDPTSNDDDPGNSVQPLPEPGALSLPAVFAYEDGCLPEEPAWVPHLRPAMPEVLGIAPKTGPPPAPRVV